MILKNGSKNGVDHEATPFLVWAEFFNTQNHQISPKPAIIDDVPALLIYNMT